MTASSTAAPNTATTSAARDHARAQVEASAGVPRPTVPPTAYDAPPAGVDAASLTWAETVPGDHYSVKMLARGTRLRLTDLTGEATAQLMLWRVDNLSERLNVADTVKVPWQAYLGAGHPLLSDQGRVLATVVADSEDTGAGGDHDLFCGTDRTGRDLLLLAASKFGLGRTDVATPASLFTRVRVADDGALELREGGRAGASVELVLHLPLIVAVATAAHPLAGPDAATGPVEVLAWRSPGEFDRLAATVPDTDPEYQRAFANTEDSWAALSKEI
ncbi:MAG: DUF1989 domain-containing protein [Gordonia sp. (in: high G+C Gram-positive bacteria)]